MSNFEFTKIIAWVWPNLSKETIISKIANMVDIFRLKLSEWFFDNHKKYIETIMKLDNSKTIMLETKGLDIRVKNLLNITVKKGDIINIDYSEYAQDNENKLFIDYPLIGELKEGEVIELEQSGVKLEIKKSNGEDNTDAIILNSWTIIQFDKVIFNNDVDFEVLSQKDKKDILRWIENGVHIIGLSQVKNKIDIIELREFLKQNQREDMKIFAKIENEEGLKNIKEINNLADWLIVFVDKINIKNLDLFKEIEILKSEGKPLIAWYAHWLNSKKYELLNEETIKKICELWIDGMIIDTIIKEEQTFDVINKISILMEKYQLKIKDKNIEIPDKNDEYIIRDYIIYNAQKITQDLDIKAIVCFTDNGYTPAKLASILPSTPIITFTKSDDTYRMLNAIRWVKWYKISSSFNYENLKRIGKEMIRIIFKWNISLDDKIIIVQANEFQRDTKSDMINGIELYKFKNI